MCDKLVLWPLALLDEVREAAARGQHPRLAYRLAHRHHGQADERDGRRRTYVCGRTVTAWSASVWADCIVTFCLLL